MTRRAVMVISCLVAVAYTAPAGAQRVEHIAAIVNDQAISSQDVDERLKLALVSSELPDTPENRRRLRPTVLRGLVDEMLQVQEARRLNIKLTGDEIDRGIARVAERNGVTESELQLYLASRNIRISTLLTRVRADLVWAKLVRRRFLGLIQIGEDEIDEVLARLVANKGMPEHLMSEIFLSVTNPDEDEQVRRDAARLVEEARGGAPFDALAEQFSQATTATAGGQVGWVQPGQTSPEIEAALSSMEEGAISDPIRSEGGYYVVKLHQRRRILVDEPSDQTVTLKQILIPVAQGGGAAEVERQLALAGTLVNGVEGCAAFDEAMQKLDTPGTGDLGTIPLGTLPAEIRAAVANLEIGAVSEPVRRETGIHLLMVCDRSGSASQIPGRDDVRDNLIRQRLALMARRYLRDLRRDAVIELR